MTRDFHLGDILTITTGRIMSPSGMGGVYEILNWMTGDNLFTHQLGRASHECEGPLLEQHPDLAAVEIPAEFEGEAHVKAWLAKQVERFGETRPVTPLALVDHTRIDPITEMQMMRPDLPIAVVEIPDTPR
ncbi:hypothetical protein OG884_05985 [Streptosporangium sp. NBC_01755]|uniref:DUF7736 domain-containing protein n=1 Tax=Streptosporangium sp. NBC_01755 TaxID=2975949 RepID=UPI002DDA5704|nr:hypothetical protein [Streptosporangium sp. NBC_01755]WSD01476.1 hypothetical protein OG884_05985 [Streptosporangium sp. NBC_01755]